MRRVEVFSILADLTSGQHGLFTRAQARSAGISDQVLEYFLHSARDLERVAYGVYRFRREPPDPHQGVWAAWLQLAPSRTAYERIHDARVPDAVVSHASAAQLYGFGELAPERHEFTISATGRTRRRNVRVHRATLSKKDWKLLHGLPVTRPARTVADLLREHRDPDDIARVVSGTLDRQPAAIRAELESVLAPFGAELTGAERDGGIAAR